MQTIHSLLLLLLGPLPACRDEPRPNRADGGAESARVESQGSGERLQLADRRRAEAIESYRRGARAAGDLALAEALAIYEREARLTSEHSDLHHELVVNAARDGRLDDAIDLCRYWLQRFPDDAAHLETLASLLFQTGRFPGSRDALLRLLVSSPDHPRWLRQLANVSLETGNAAEAIEIATRLLAVSKDLAREDRLAADRVAAKTFVHFESYHAAQPCLERLVAHAPEQPLFRLDLGRTYRALGQIEKAIESLTPLREHPSLGDEALRSLARIELDRGRTRAAIESLETLLTRSPWDAAGYVLLLRAESRLGHTSLTRDLDAAREALTRSQREGAKAFAASANGDPVKAAWHRALSFDAAGRYREAEDALSVPAIARHPETHLSRAKLFLSWTRGHDAWLVLSQLGAGSPTARALRAVALERTGDVRGALALIDPATLESLDDPSLLAEIASWALAEGDLALARRIATGGVEKADDPLSIPRALRARHAELAIRSGEPEIARAQLEASAAQGGLSDLESIWLARALHDTGASAEETLARLETLPPAARTSVEALRVRVHVLSRNGESEAFQMASSVLQQAERELAERARLVREIATASWPESWKSRARLAEALAASDHDEALRTARLATAAAPDEPRVWRLVARLADRPEELFLRRHAWRHVLRLEPDAEDALGALKRSEVPRE